MRWGLIVISAFLLLAGVSYAAEAPAPRFYHAMSELSDGSALLYGGVNLNGETLGDTWIYSVEEGWTEIIPTNNPRPLSGHEMILLDDGTVFMFAGRDENGELIDHYYKFEDFDWSPKLDFETPFPGYEMMNACYIESELKDGAAAGAVGGLSNNGPNLINYWFDPNIMGYVQKASIETPAVDSVAVASNGNMYLLGVAPNSFYVYNPVTDAWETKTVNPAPSPRYSSAHAQVGNTGYIFGGMSTEERGPLNDAWLFDMATETFVQIENPPFDLYGAAAVPVYSSGDRNGEDVSILIFGGVDGSGNASEDDVFYNTDDGTYTEEPTVDDDADDDVDDDSDDDADDDVDDDLDDDADDDVDDDSNDDADDDIDVDDDANADDDDNDDDAGGCCG